LPVPADGVRHRDGDRARDPDPDHHPHPVPAEQEQQLRHRLREMMSTTDLSRTARTRIADTTVWIVLAAGAIFMLAPLLWMVSTSLKTQLEVFALPPVWIPEVPQWDTYVRMWQDSYVLSGLKNSAIVAFSVTIIGTLTCSLAAFALAKMRLPARNVIFIGLLSEIGRASCRGRVCVWVGGRRGTKASFGG